MGILAAAGEQCDAAAAIFGEVQADRGFAALQPQLRSGVLELNAICAARADRKEEALALTRRAVAEPRATALGWGLHLALLSDLAGAEDVLSAFHTLARTRPELLKDLPDDTVRRVYALASERPNPEAERLSLLDDLRRAAYRPADPAEPGDDFTFEHARLLLAAGRTAEAREVARGLTSPFHLVALKVDSRLAPLRTGSGPLNIRTAAAPALNDARGVLSENTDRLSGVLRLAAHHLTLGEAETALRILDGAAARARRKGPGGFVDADAKLAQVHGMRGSAFDQLGRKDDALSALAEAAATPVSGSENVDGKITLAGYLVDLEKPTEVMEVLSSIGAEDLSDHGRAWVASMRACVHAQRRDTAAFRREMALVEKPRQPPAYDALLNAQVCANDLDAAAATVIARLEDPSERTYALVELQGYRNHPRYTASGRRWQAGYDALPARPDVRAAVVKAGGSLERFDIFAPLY